MYIKCICHFHCSTLQRDIIQQHRLLVLPLTREIPYRTMSNFYGKRNKNITHINPIVPELNGCGNLRERRI